MSYSFVISEQKNPKYLFMNELPLLIRHSKRQNYSIRGIHDQGSLLNGNKNGALFVMAGSMVFAGKVSIQNFQISSI